MYVGVICSLKGLFIEGTTPTYSGDRYIKMRICFLSLDFVDTPAKHSSLIFGLLFLLQESAVGGRKISEIVPEDQPKTSQTGICGALLNINVKFRAAWSDPKP